MRCIVVAVLIFFSCWAVAEERLWPPETQMNEDGFYPESSGSFIGTEVVLKTTPELLKPGVTFFVLVKQKNSAQKVFAATGKLGAIKDGQIVHGETCQAIRKVSVLTPLDAPMTEYNGYWLCTYKLMDANHYFIRLDDPVLSLK
ncbi:hypothetical protein FNI18_06035 [Salmonella enterica subsp. salamae]|nr:hypothetical protein [Salmonella enterica subsp. salamae]